MIAPKLFLGLAKVGLGLMELRYLTLSVRVPTKVP